MNVTLFFIIPSSLETMPYTFCSESICWAIVVESAESERYDIVYFSRKLTLQGLLNSLLFIQQSSTWDSPYQTSIFDVQACTCTEWINICVNQYFM